MQSRIGRYRNGLQIEIVPDIPNYPPIRKLPEVIELHYEKDQARRILIRPALFTRGIKYRQLSFDPFRKKPTTNDNPHVRGSLIQGCPVAVSVFIRDSVAVCRFISGRFYFNSVYIFDFLTATCHVIMTPRRAIRGCLRLSESFYMLMLHFWVNAF